MTEPYFRLIEKQGLCSEWTEVEGFETYMQASRAAKERSTTRPGTYQRVIGDHVNGAVIITYSEGMPVYNM